MLRFFKKEKKNNLIDDERLLILLKMLYNEMSSFDVSLNKVGINLAVHTTELFPSKYVKNNFNFGLVEDVYDEILKSKDSKTIHVENIIVLCSNESKKIALYIVNGIITQIKTGLTLNELKSILSRDYTLDFTKVVVNYLNPPIGEEEREFFSKLNKEVQLKINLSQSTIVKLNGITYLKFDETIEGKVMLVDDNSVIHIFDMDNDEIELEKHKWN